MVRSDRLVSRGGITLRALLLATAVAAITGCKTTPAVSSGMKLDPEAGTRCSVHCESLGMDLGAVVIIHSSTGCVCEPRGQAGAKTGGASAVTGGAAIQAMDEEQSAHNRQASNGRR